MRSNGEALRGFLALKLFAVLVLTSGCFYDVSENGDEEALGAVSQAVNGANAIGVIPIGTDADGIGTTCPRESTSIFTPIASLVTLFMDDEDDDNQDKLSNGWVAPNTSNPWFWFGMDGHNTTLRFCRVEGGLFLPKTTSPGDTANFYSVLSLGTNCPAGSTRVGYYIDNEDDQNINSSSGPFAPNSTNSGKFSSTTLFFCVYRSLAFSMAQFPDLGAPYAVFHTWDRAQQPAWVMSKHAKYTDDEDDQNQNHVLTPNDPGVVAELQKMVGMGSNSTYSMARVR
jgi:hypothetical protein